MYLGEKAIIALVSEKLSLIAAKFSYFIEEMMSDLKNEANSNHSQSYKETQSNG